MGKKSPSGLSHENHDKTSQQNSSSTNTTTTASEFVPDYIFTQRAPLLYLDVGFLARHAVRRINVTVDEGCVTKGPGWAWLLGATAGAARGLDTVVVNQLMFSLRGDGFLRVRVAKGRAHTSAWV